MSTFYWFIVNTCFLGDLKWKPIALLWWYKFQMDFPFKSALFIEKDKHFAADIEVSSI